VKSIVLEEPGVLRLEEMQPPDSPGMGEVQVRVRQVGICGTDLHAFQGNQPFFEYPRILGHELAAEVVQIGPMQQPNTLRVGDRCCIQPYLNCGKCGACRRGFENCCEHMRVIGVHQNGGMQELINVPVDKVYKSTLDDDALALVEMLSIGARAVRRACIIPGEHVMVVGVGPIGLGVSLLAQQAGAQVVVVDLSDQRLNFAQRHLGIEHAIQGKQNVLERLNAIVPGDLPTVVFDATGSLQSMKQSFNYVAHGGRLVFVGFANGDVTFSDPEFHRREITLLASRNATTQDFNQVMTLLDGGAVNISPWITHRVSPEQMVQDFHQWVEPGTSVVKAIMRF
jgi:2-desacetyl-2-hydroxyethyl bacteriochlorophyllide A dehydrogenase